MLHKFAGSDDARRPDFVELRRSVIFRNLNFFSIFRQNSTTIPFGHHFPVYEIGPESRRLVAGTQLGP
jgi:hypothetical protein